MVICAERACGSYARPTFDRLTPREYDGRTPVCVLSTLSGAALTSEEATCGHRDWDAARGFGGAAAV